MCGKPRNMPRPCTAPHTAAQLQPIHALRLRRPARIASWIFMIDRQRLALGGGVDYGVVHINYVVTWTANQSGLVTLTFDLLTLKVESECGVLRVTSDVGYLCANLSLPRPLLSRVYARCTRQTDRRQIDVRSQTKASLNAPPIRGGSKKPSARCNIPRNKDTKNPSLQSISRTLHCIEHFIPLLLCPAPNRRGH